MINENDMTDAAERYVRNLINNGVQLNAALEILVGNSFICGAKWYCDQILPAEEKKNEMVL
jgi:hypothetical protein